MTKVHIIFDVNWGAKIRDIPVEDPIWIVKSQINHPETHWAWGSRSNDGAGEVTQMDSDPNDSPEETFLKYFEIILDFHEHDISNLILHFIGIAPTEQIQDVLDKHAFLLHRRISDLVFEAKYHSK
ncbi:MAG: hypothetical protein GY714_10760 [Desulfobacterales bacterium]|nr:hypothetical protein [Desulfobacterales bacterium]MCP4161596.1 hypothetical protein [Deltaproteobacteria bacterium]